MCSRPVSYTHLSQTFRVEQLLTDAVVREFNARTQYHVLHDAKDDADAVLRATVLSATAAPLVYDSTTGRAVSALVTVSVQVVMTDRRGKVLFENPAYLFHEQYEISSDLPSFFQEDSPAIDRVSRDFARTLVAVSYTHLVSAVTSTRTELLGCEGWELPSSCLGLV